MASNLPKGHIVASPLVQRIYLLLAEHPEGMAISQLHDALRDGWDDIRSYDAYARRLNRRHAAPQGQRARKTAYPGPANSKRPPGSWGSAGSR